MICLVPQSTRSFGSFTYVIPALEHHVLSRLIGFARRRTAASSSRIGTACRRPESSAPRTSTSGNRPRDLSPRHGFDEFGLGQQSAAIDGQLLAKVGAGGHIPIR